MPEGSNALCRQTPWMGPFSVTVPVLAARQEDSVHFLG